MISAKIQYTLLLTAAVFTATLPALCAGQSTDTNEHIEQPAAVPQALSKARMLTGKPNLKAQIYIYMQTATWCGPCRMAMPAITEEYAAMKKDGRAELILINFDQDPVDGRSYIEAQMADLCALHMTSPGLRKLPGFTPARFIPDVTIVSADGKVLQHGGHEVVAQWRKYVQE